MSGKNQSLASGAIACVLSLAGCNGSSSMAVEPASAQNDLTPTVAQLNNNSIEFQNSTASRPENDPPEVISGPEQDSSILVDSRRFALDAALGDIWGVQDEHYQVDFTVTNGKFIISPTVIDGVTHNLLKPADATAIFHAEMFSPGTSFSFVAYSYSSFGAGDGVLAGNAFFSDAFVSFDANDNGTIDTDEAITVIGGTVNFTGSLPDIALDFTVTLENGLTAQGHYTGLFDFTER